MSENRQLSAAKSTAVSDTRSANDMMNTLDEMARDPNFDIDKMERIAKLKIDLYEIARKEQFNKDFNNAVFAMPVIAKDGTIKGGANSKYTSFERLMSVIQPILRANNLLVTFNVENEGNVPKVGTIVRHANGLTQDSGLMPVPLGDTNKATTRPQVAAMSVTMGKRHMLKATFGIVEEDDDGFGKMYITVESEDWQKELEAEAMRLSIQGVEVYKSWYDKREAMKRGYLYDIGLHKKCMAAARAADGGSHER